MPPFVSPERAAKRSRTLQEGGDGEGGGGGDDGRAGTEPSQSQPRQPLVQKQPPQQQAPQPLLQQPAKSPSQAGPRLSQLQPQSQPESQALSSQPQPQPHTQSQPQPHTQSQPRPHTQSQPQPQTQSQPQSSQPQSQQLQADVSLPSGAVAVLPTAVPQWAEAALRSVDPFWEPKETLAVITTQQAGPAPGTHGQLQGASALFTVSAAALTAIAEKKAQARLVCLQPSDSGTPHRCHWYGGSYVMLNGRPYEVTKADRVSLQLGPNQADQAVDVSYRLLRGTNRLTLLWPLGIAGAVAVLRLCEHRRGDELRRRLAPPLPLAHAVKLVRAHVAGEAPPPPEGAGASAPPAAEADRAVLGCGSVTLSLRCPLSGGLAAAPAHFGCTAAAAPLAFFDLGPFLELAERSGSWVCPASGRLGDLQDLRPHAFLTAVLRTLDHNGVRGRVEAIEVSPCGRWRPKDSRVPLLSAMEGGSVDGGNGRGSGSGSRADRSPPTFDPRLLDPEDDAAAALDVVDLTDD